MVQRPCIRDVVRLPSLVSPLNLLLLLRGRRRTKSNSCAVDGGPNRAPAPSMVAPPHSLRALVTHVPTQSSSSSSSPLSPRTPTAAPHPSPWSTTRSRGVPKSPQVHGLAGVEVVIRDLLPDLAQLFLAAGSMCRTARARTPSIPFLHLHPGVVGLVELLRELHQPVRRGPPD